MEIDRLESNDHTESTPRHSHFASLYDTRSDITGPGTWGKERQDFVGRSNLASS